MAHKKLLLTEATLPEIPDGKMEAGIADAITKAARMHRLGLIALTSQPVLVLPTRHGALYG